MTQQTRQNETVQSQELQKVLGIMYTFGVCMRRDILGQYILPGLQCPHTFPLVLSVYIFCFIESTTSMTKIFM